MRKLSMMEAIHETIQQEMHRDSAVIVMGEDVGKFGGAFHVTHDLLKEFGPRRVWDTPISEAGFTGMGIGAALTGLAGSRGAGSERVRCPQFDRHRSPSPRGRCFGRATSRD